MQSIQAAAPDRRYDIIEYLERELIGPAAGEEEALEKELPYRRYLMGTLYAQGSDTSTSPDETEIPDTAGLELSDESQDEPVVRANDWRPSSVGLSFYCMRDVEVECCVWFAQYRESKLTRRFIRIPRYRSDAPLVLRFALGVDRQPITIEGSTIAQVRLVRRRFGEGVLFTASLINLQREAERADGKADPEKALYQAGLLCSPLSVPIAEYPSVSRLSSDPEQQELQLAYSDKKIYGIGHGCAAEPVMTGRAAMAIRSQLLPRYLVPGVKPTLERDYPILEMARLAVDATDGELCAELRDLAHDYALWIAGQEQLVRESEARYTDAAARIIDRLRACCREIECGIKTIESDPLAMRAFRLANRVMIDQMNRPVKALRPPAWYPFQLAFILRTIPSIAEPSSPDRTCVDLLWFPTGGGKTEAYLGLAAFTIFYRRLKFQDEGAGTAIITRYTLRLLTAQQFERTAKVICAAELVRQSDTAMFGAIPITLGLWVGGDTTPNNYQDAIEKREAMLQELRPNNPFQVSKCPWCAHEMIPSKRGRPDQYGVRADNQLFEFFCPSTECAFHDRLPLSVVDEDLYAHPPTMVVGTVDKFARLCWEPRSGAFFGGRFRKPDLIIQDELHLLSGPLGTTVGLYESAIEALCCKGEIRPKIIASTATIRRAAEQVRGLFGRERTRLFPPSGLRADDSYFASIDTAAPGRVYAGIMSQSHTAATSMVNSAAALLQSPQELNLEGDLLDAYWTLVVYHNSLHELGRTITLARDDIPARLKATGNKNARRVPADSVVELTGNVPGWELPQILQRAEIKAPAPGALSLIACTNMLSVGVDISRLGLMLVNGQPKTTSEYIQATSRVGRSKERPGLVVTMYSSTRPRDRSHYERFLPYHSAFYRAVEPTSVTPFSIQARRRALHAALVILVRHGLGYADEEHASRFRKDDPALKPWIEALKQRIHLVDPIEAAAACAELDDLIDIWDRIAKETPNLRYRAQKPFRGILVSFEDDPVPETWPTLNSMRSVDRVCKVEVAR